jgi:hypothetical protein
MEISDRYFSISNQNFRRYGVKNVFPFLGDSTHVLPEILKMLDENLIFWLDGHWSMGDTGKGEKQSPLLEECHAILEYCNTKNKKAILMIDDVRLFGRNQNQIDWKDITVESIEGVLKPFIKNSFIENDIFYILLDKN